jgi:hypothetical protein
MDMFGIELSNILIDECKESGNSGYVINNQGKPKFSSNYTDSAVSIIKIDSESDLTLSESDRLEMNEKNLAFTIIGKTKDHSKSYLPDRYLETVNYENRIYLYGLLDCYTLIRDYFRNNYNIWIPANIDRSFGWWHNGRNLYVDMYEQYGFKETSSSIKKDDVLIFRFDNGMPSHSAIYLGQGKMLHHMLGRFSCVENFDGTYKMGLVGVLRHGDLE